MKIKDLSIRQITLIQLSIATVLTLLYQFVLPIAFLPLDAYIQVNDIPNYGVPNQVIFTLTQWTFSLSIVWLLYRENKYLNNYLIYSMIPLLTTFFGELFMFGLFWDYIHVVPIFICFYIILKKRDMLEQRYFYYANGFNVLWSYAVYFLRLAYYSEVFLVFTINMMILVSLNFGLSFNFRKSKKKPQSIVPPHNGQ